MRTFAIRAVLNGLGLGAVLLSCSAFAGGEITVDPAKSVIALAAVNPDASRSPTVIRLLESRLQEAADELQKHLKLITEVEIPIVPEGKTPDGKYSFHVGTAPPNGGDELLGQETRWTVTLAGTYLHSDGGRGELYAVYGFLEDQLGVHWFAPGDDGIVYRQQSPLALRPGTHQWVPKLRYRSIRLGSARISKAKDKPGQKRVPFRPTIEEHNSFARDVWQWQMRMRMYGRNVGGGHAFNTWWKKYGESHPEYFALNKFGKREPVPLPKGKERSEAFIKICPSNPKVTEQVIADVLPRKNSIQFISVGPNDGATNFCECAACRQLDAPREGEAWDAHLTDRYVHFANAVAREARKHREDAHVTMYAYLGTLTPPRRLKLEPNVVVQLVPYVDPLDLVLVKEHFEGWRDAGAKTLALRPNYHHKYMATCMPIGIEKQMFDVFQIAYANGCVATNYDSLIHHWPVTGITDYILAKSMAEPDEPFERWAEQYYSAFGDAVSDVREYYEYWRNQVWEERLRPNLIKICNLGGAGDFCRGLFWSLGKYYKLSDFKKAARILGRAAKKKLSPTEAKRLEQLRLANEHARLTYQAVVAPPYEKPELARPLLTFRKAHERDLPLTWWRVFGFEKGNGDLTGMEIKDEMREYLKPWYRTDLFWKFRLDRKNVGKREKWYEKT